MTRDFSCPSCGHPMAIPDDGAGTELYCTGCGAPFSVPSGPPPTDAMSCPRCGSPVAPDASFCAACGAATGTAPVAIRRPPIVTVLAVLAAIGGGFGILVGLGGLAAGLGDTPDSGLMAALFGFYLVIGVLGIACAIGLWTLKPWGRGLQIGLAIFGLIGIPIGTIVSILVLYYFFKPEIKLVFSGREVEDLSPDERVLAAKAAGSSSIVAVVIAVVVIGFFMCGIISAIAIPNLLNAINRSRQKRSMADMRTIGTACEAYAVDYRHYPVDIASLDELAPILTPTYLVRTPALDGWRVPFQVSTAADGTWYMIASLGRDKLPGDRPGGPTMHFDCDIVYSNGQFIQYPEGIQTE